MKKDSVLTGVFNILLGVLLIVKRGSMVNLLLSVLAIGFIVWGIVNLISGIKSVGIVKILLGVALWLFGSLFLKIAVYLVAVWLVIQGVLNLGHALQDGTGGAITKYISPVLSVGAGAVLLFNGGDVLSLPFLLAGITLVVQGVLSFF